MVNINERIVVVVPSGLSIGVTQSQVFKLINLFDDKYNIDFVCINKDSFSYLKEKKECKINDYFIKNNVKMIYTRSIFDYCKLKKICRKVPIYHDFRGSVFAESYLRNGSIIRAFILLILEGYVYLTADYISTVSESYSKLLKKMFIIHRKINVIPCCIDNNNIKINNNVINGNKFVYVGGASKYQNITLMIVLLNKLSKERKVELTIVSNQVEEIKKQLYSIHKVDFNISYVSLKHEDVNKYIMQFDFGFILRDNLLLNKVASPIKLLEYSSSGVIPIITPYVGDYSQIMINKKIAINYNGELTWKDIDDIALDVNIRKKLYYFSLEYTWAKYKYLMDVVTKKL